MIQKIKNNKILLPILLNYFVLGAFLYYIIFLWKSYPFSIGGSIVFISVIGIINYFSIAYKDYAMELSLFSLVLFLLMALNHLAFFEYKHGYSVSIEIMIGALTLTVATLACVLTIKLLS